MIRARAQAQPLLVLLEWAALKVKDGDRLMRTLVSHHYLLMTGHNLADIYQISKIFDLMVDAIT